MIWIANNLTLLMVGLAILLILIIVGVLILGIVLQRRDRAAAGPQPEPAPVPRTDFRELTRTVARRVSVGQRDVDRASSLDRIEDLPWAGLVGLPGSGASRLVDDLVLPWQTESAQEMAEVRVRVLREGVVIDFGEDILDADDWEHRWRAMVRGVRGQRPDRPIEGLVIAVPTSSLVGPSALAPDQLEAAGERLGELLGATQAVTGFRLPVYLVLTGSECLPGFADFIENGLEPEHRDQMLGWSAPYGVDKVFVEGWIAEGLMELRRGLEALQTTVLLQLDDDALQSRLVDDVFTFSREIQDLDEPLAALLLPAMRTTALQSPAIFRGLFLAAGPETVPEPAPADGHEPHLLAVRPRGYAFVRDLFETKVFREHRLAEPSRFFATERHVTVYRLRWTVAVISVLAAIGLLYQWTGHSERPDVIALLDKIQSYEDRAREFQFREARFEDLSPAAIDIVESMSRIESRRLATLAAPTSFVSGVDDEVTEAIEAGMTDFVLPALEKGLSQRLAGILRSALQDDDEKTTISDDERFALSLDNLVRLVSGLKEFNARITDYQEIVVGHSLEPLSRLASYALYHPTTSRVDPDNPLYHFEMSNWATDYALPIAEWRTATEQDMQAEIGPRIELIYESTPLFSSLANISATLKTLTGADTGRRPAVASRAQLAGLVDLIARAEALLASSDSNWIETGELSRNPIITSLINEVGQLSFVSSDVASRLLRRRDRARNKSRGEALALTGLNNRPLLVQNQHGIQLAPVYPALKTELIALLNSPYLSATADQQTSRGRSGVSFQWEITRLQDMLEAIEWRQSTVVDAISRLPAEFGMIVDDFVQAHLDERFEAQIISAQRPLAVGSAGGGRDAAEIRAFATSEPVLIAVDQGLSVLGLPTALQQLRAAAVPQAERLLAAVDATLANQGPYELYDPLLTSWNGSGPFAANAFGVGNIASLRTLLANTRGFIDILSSDQAAPLVTYLGGERRARSASAERLVEKWEGIADSLVDYQAKKPRNGLAMLEQFVLNEMDQITIDNCREATGSAPVGSDYFGQKHYNILIAIRERCASMEADTAETAYAALSRDFARTLAGRFPFVGIGPRAPFTDPGATGKSAEPTAVRLFLNANSARIDSLANALSLPEYASTASGQAAAEFVGALVDTRTALSPLLAKTQPPPTLAYRMRFSFRTNVGFGRADEQILEWAVTSGDTTVSSFGTEDTLSWTQGDPITVTLHWARNAPQIPAESQPMPAIVQGTTVTYSYADRWALFSFLGAHAPGAAALDTLPDPTANVLAFEVALKTNPEAATGIDVTGDTAVAYARVDVFPGATPPQPSEPPEQPVDMPYFPAAAPKL